MFKRNTQLASYLVAQIGVLCKMASGRSYNVIDWLTRTFSYEMLVSMASNYYLPYQITQGACNLVRVLYLDRYPQLPFCAVLSSRRCCGSTRLCARTWTRLPFQCYAQSH